MIAGYRGGCHDDDIAPGLTGRLRVGTGKVGPATVVDLERDDDGVVVSLTVRDEASGQVDVVRPRATKRELILGSRVWRSIAWIQGWHFAFVLDADAVRDPVGA